MSYNSSAASGPFKFRYNLDHVNSNVNVPITVLKPFINSSIDSLSFSVDSTGSAVTGVEGATHADALPDGITLNASTGVITGTPTSPGKRYIKVIAESGEYEASVTVIFDVVEEFVGSKRIESNSRSKFIDTTEFVDGATDDPVETSYPVYTNDADFTRGRIRHRNVAARYLSSKSMHTQEGYVERLSSEEIYAEAGHFDKGLTTSNIRSEIIGIESGNMRDENNRGVGYFFVIDPVTRTLKLNYFDPSSGNGTETVQEWVPSS